MNRHGSMNRAYRLVWSAVRDVWIPVAETARGRGKRASRTLVAATLFLGTAMTHAGGLSGGPSGGQVTAGTGSIAQSGALTTITQHSPTLSLSWSGFDIAPQATVDFVQPSASAIAVNRIIDPNGTRILGHLNANGQVYLINPNGILFGPGAELNVGGLVASTLDLNGASLDGSARYFSGGGTIIGSVVNQGTITTAPGGYVALLGSHVSNQGAISAPLGAVALAAGSAMTLSFSGDSLLHLQVDQSVWRSVAENGGLIRADGGQVVMTAGARDALVASVVNNTGVIEARTVDAHEGRITLLGGMTAGTVDVGGVLDASAPNGGNGGSIETSAEHVEIADGAKITTAAASGLYGSWLIDPRDFTVAASGGDITGAALSGELGTTDVMLQSSAGGMHGEGDVNVNDAVSWSANTVLTLTAADNVHINANITASGNSAGLIINPRTANGTEQPDGGGAFTLMSGASITLSGAAPSLSIGGIAYTVINTLGVAGSMTGTDLQGINGALGGNYALGSNIDASVTSTWNAGAGFTPIGSNAAQFGGSFDGLGHTISNLTINTQSSEYVGMFGYVASSGSIANVGLVAGTVSSVGSAVGGLAGRNDGSIADSYTTLSITGNSSFAGGLVGENTGSIIRSHATGTVSGQEIIGGLVGFNQFGATIGTSYATGAVSGSTYVGGLVGLFRGTGSDLYATGAVSGSNRVGGLIGTIDVTASITNSYATGSVSGGFLTGGLVATNYGTVSNSYATGAVNGGNYVGGLVGFNNAGAINDSYATGAVSGTGNVGGLVGSGRVAAATDSYWNITSSGQAGSYEGIGLTTTQMQTALNFGGFNFTATPGATGNNWVMVDADGSLNNAGGAAGATFPMLASEYSTIVTNAHQLQLMAMNLAAGYTLGQNIDASATAVAATLGSSDVWSTPGGFVPIGSVNTMFSGVFDGAGHTIGDLTIYLPGAMYVGLFGAASGSAVIQNVGMVGGSVTGNSYVGDLVSFNQGTLSNSYATGAVSALSGTVGGLVAFNLGTISNSYATGSVTGSTYAVGGLVGTSFGAISTSHAGGTVSAGSGNNVGGLVGNDGGPISNSYATGAVSGGNYVGGLVGTAATEGIYPITNSYATGAVTGTSKVGGLIGSNSFAVSDSYATGAVVGSGTVGGLVGINHYGTISSSHATGSVSGDYQLGGLVGYNSIDSTIDTSFAAGNVSGVSYYSGGLVGQNFGAISNSFATGSVAAGGGFGGGLAGSSDGTVSNSYATGNVTGASYLGGLVGAHYGSASTVSNSYATGAVSGTTQVGGLVGHNYGGATISNSYATGSVSSSVAGSANAVGGLVGQNDGAVASSFWNVAVNTIGIGGGSTTGASGLSSAAMMTAGNFSAAGWSISATGGSGLVWRIYQGSTAPLLLSFLTPLTVTAGDASRTYDGAIVPASTLPGASYSVAGAAGSGDIFNVNDAYAGAINVGSYAPRLYSDQQGYDISYVGSTLTIAPATLTETATPASRAYGQANPALSGSVTGFVGGDTLANATSGALVWTTPAVAASHSGHYAIDGGGLTAMNYVLVEATGNAAALTVEASTAPVIPPVVPPVIPPVTPPGAGTEGAALNQAQTAAGTLEANLPEPPTTDELMRSRKRADATLPALRIVGGGVKLPAELADADAH